MGSKAPRVISVPEIAGYFYVGGAVEGIPNPRYTVPIWKGERRLPDRWHCYTLTKPKKRARKTPAKQERRKR